MVLVASDLTERIAETLSGYTSSVVVNLFGPDLNVLDQKAHDVLDVMGKVQGAADARIQSPPGTITVAIPVVASEAPNIQPGVSECRCVALSIKT